MNRWSHYRHWGLPSRWRSMRYSSWLKRKQSNFFLFWWNFENKRHIKLVWLCRRVFQESMNEFAVHYLKLSILWEEAWEYARSLRVNIKDYDATPFLKDHKRAKSTMQWGLETILLRPFKWGGTLFSLTICINSLLPPVNANSEWNCCWRENLEALYSMQGH